MHPERIGRLVLTNCGAFENFLPPMFHYLQYGAHLPGFLEVMARMIGLRALHRLPFTFGRLSKRLIVANSSVFQGILKRAEEQFANGETISPDEFWRKLEASKDA